MAQTLTLGQFLKQLADEGALGLDTPVVIRGEHGDHTLAAVHVDGDRLVFDLGLEVDPWKPLTDKEEDNV